MIEVTDGRCAPGTPGAIGGKREVGVFPLEDAVEEESAPSRLLRCREKSPWVSCIAAETCGTSWTSSWSGAAEAVGAIGGLMETDFLAFDRRWGRRSAADLVSAGFAD